MTHIRDFTDYKVFLKNWLEGRRALRRGLRSSLAKAADCQAAFVSQVLNGKPHFSPEQALGIAGFMQLSPAETKYFMSLLQLARAGTRELRTYWLSELNSQRLELLNLKNLVGEARVLTNEEKNLYYSSWIYVVVHMLVTIPKYRTIKEIAVAANLSVASVQGALDKLVSLGLVIISGEDFLPGNAQMHLPSDSPMILQHHGNLRAKALDHIARGREKGVHYSTISSLSVKDAQKLRSRLTEVVREYTETVRESPEETLVGFNLDFYELI